MLRCEECLNSEISDWDYDAVGEKAIPIYWCERKLNFCTDIVECDSFDEFNKEVRNEDK